MPDPDHLLIKVTQAGIPDVNAIYSYAGLTELRPSYTNEMPTPISLEWIDGVKRQWLFTPLGTPDPWGDCYYQTYSRVDWCYEMIQAEWQLGPSHGTLPLPVLELPTSPDRPGATTLLIDGQPHPYGIHNPTPTLAWTYIPANGGPPQDAYQIHMASSLLLLDAHQPDLWNTGIVESAAHQAIYAGEKLGNLQMYFWAVRVRDASGVWSADWYAPD